MEPTPSETARGRRRLRSRSATLLRRVHLYLGLYLVPWVLLYGVSALLFNHPDWGTSRRIEDLDPERIAVDGALPLVPERLAAEVAAALRAALGDRALDRPRRAALVGGLYYRGASEDAEGRVLESYTVRVDPAGRGARVWVRPADAVGDPLDPLAELGPLAVADEHLAAVGAALGRALVDTAEAPLRLDLRAAPDLHFEADLAGVPHAVTYRLRDGRVSARPLAGGTRSPDPERTTRVLKDLHTEHGYLPWFGGQSAWAGFVDLMGAAMVLWGVSGLVMWWQLRRLRRPGLWALTASLASAGAVLAALWPSLG